MIRDVALLSCPFCNELYPSTETEVCPVCDVRLRPPARSLDTQDSREDVDPDDRLLPWTHLRDGRGLLLGACVLGLGMFFAPWLVLETPDVRTLSGFQLTGTRGFWFGGGAVALFVLAPLVVTRRSKQQMRGARAIASLLASVTFWQALLLFALAPPGRSGFVSYGFGYGLYVSAVVSLLATWVALHFGGSKRASSLVADSAPLETSSDGNDTLH